MNKKLILKIVVGFIIGALIGFAIKYFRDVALAPYLCGLAGAIVGMSNYKKLKS